MTTAFPIPNIVMESELNVVIGEHPLARLAAFVTEFPKPLGESTTPEWIVDMFRLKPDSTPNAAPALAGAIRAMLRYGGYKPSGRGKPASEYLLRAATEGGLSSINLAVDVCNAISLHRGFPISVVDLDLATPPFRIGIAATGESYVFNPSGQEIALGGLVCLFDADGPCANAVRDSQRTKTGPKTKRTMSVIWGAAGHEEALAETAAEYRRVLEAGSASTQTVEMTAAASIPGAPTHPASVPREHPLDPTPSHG